jgi:hypothetical protein
MNDMNEPKPEPRSDKNSQESIEAAEAEARKRAIESQQKEIVVFPPEPNDGETKYQV